MAVTVEKLEEIYTQLLRSVAREVARIEQVEEMTQMDCKLLESGDKILRSALEYYSNKGQKSELADLADDDLMREFE